MARCERLVKARRTAVVDGEKAVGDGWQEEGQDVEEKQKISAKLKSD
jgi:hypothetical protein